MLPWKPRKRQILPVSQNLSLVYFSPAKFRLVSSNLSLAIVWQMTHTQKLPKLCSATFKYKLQLHTSSVIFTSSLHKKKKMGKRLFNSPAGARSGGGPTTPIAPSTCFVYLWSTDLWHHIRLQSCCSVFARSTKMDARCHLVFSLF